MFIIKWANGKGHTLVITPSEVAVLEQVIQDAKRTSHGESRDFDIDISPILEPGGMALVAPHFKLKGQAKYVFAMLNLLATTELLEDDVYWWSVRAVILAKDRDLQPCLNINMRTN